MTRRLCLTAALALALAAPAPAGIRPTFSPGAAAWEATDVAVIGRDGKVLEAWRGGLGPGDQLPLKAWDLPPAPTLMARASGDGWPASGDRLIVFLVRSAKGPGGWQAARSWAPEAIYASVVWSEPGGLYAFQ